MWPPVSLAEPEKTRHLKLDFPAWLEGVAGAQAGRVRVCAVCVVCV